MELPKTLEMLLSTLTSSFKLISWNINEDYNGLVSVKLRFRGRDHYTPGEYGQSGMSFKRKSQSQMNRDFSRAQAHNRDQIAANDTPVCDTETRSRPRVTTRSMAQTATTTTKVKEIEHERYEHVDGDVPGLMLSPPTGQLADGICHAMTSNISVLSGDGTLSPEAPNFVQCQTPAPSVLPVMEPHNSLDVPWHRYA
jgi:hypothetical protein